MNGQISQEGIKSLNLILSKYEFSNNDVGTYQIIGRDSLNEEINLTNSSIINIELASPISGVTLNTELKTINTSNIPENAAGCLIVSCNDIVQCQKIYFIKD